VVPDCSLFEFESLSTKTSNPMHILIVHWWLPCYLVHRLRALFSRPGRGRFLRRSRCTPTPEELSNSHTARSNRRKPEWVRREVLRLKALMPKLGCRKIADTFCYLYAARGETVGHTFVANLVKAQAEAILRLRREMKNRLPKKVPRNLIWALDLTFLPTPGGSPVLGVIDHGSRACLALRELTTRRSIDILPVLFDLTDTFGKPTILRTDNEPIFTSRLFRASLWLLGIRHRRSAPFAPWQNGRIERLFLTFKDRIRIWTNAAEAAGINQTDLDLFRAWYNGVRPHQHLEGHIVPAEAWAGKKLRSSRPRYFNAWDGALTGFY
jgi:transposase InsO family protein